MAATVAGAIEANLAGQINGQVAVGNYNVQNNVDNGAVLNYYEGGQAPIVTRRVPPPGLRGRRPPDPLGREAEVADALGSLREASAMEFVGPPGVGKTTLLKHVAYQAPLPAGSGGIVYREVPAGETVRDTLQFLWDAFYSTNVKFVPNDAQLQIDLSEIRAVVVLDDFERDRSDLGRVMDALPAASFLFASSHRALWGVGRSVALPGLGEDAAVALLQRELGRPLDDEDRAAAAAIVKAVGGRPLAVLQVAALVPKLGTGLAPLCEDLQRAPSAAEALARRLIETLTEAERSVLSLLTMLAGATLPAKELAELTGVDDAGPIVESLLKLGLIQAHSPRYSATVTAVAHASSDATASWSAAARTYFMDWTERHQGRPGAVLEEEQAVMAVLRSAAKDGAWSDVLRLGRALEGPLLVGGRWGAWREVLELELTGARRLGDRRAEGWALHQIGSRALGLGDGDVARANLTEALQIREDRGDGDGAAVTRHNLGLLSGGHRPGGWRRRGGGWLPGLPLIILGGGLIILLPWLFWPPGPDDPNPPGRRGEVRIEPARLDFGDQPVGTVSSPRRVTVVNDGDKDAAIGRVSLSGDGAGAYRADRGCDQAVLSAGTQCTISVVFGPPDEGGRRAQLVITRPEGDRSVVTLTGTGTGNGTPPPESNDIELIPAAIDFGRVEIGKSISRTLIVRNTGSSDLEVRPAVEPDGGQFSITDNPQNPCPDKLPRGGNCAVLVTYVPGVAGPHNGGVVVTAGPSAVSARATLSGTGSSPGPPTCALIVPTDPQIVTYRSTITLAVSGRGSSPSTLTATGVPEGLTFRDRGDGTGELSGTVSAPPGDVPITVTCRVAGTTASKTFTLRILRSELTVRWAQSLLDLLLGPATATAIVTQPAGSQVDLGSLKLAFDFTNVLTQAKTTFDGIPVSASGRAAFNLEPGTLPPGAYTVRARLGDANPYFNLNPPAPPTAVVVNTDVLSATVYTLSDLLNLIMP